MGEWVSVKDGLPDSSIDVLAYSPGDGSCVAFHNGKSWLVITDLIEARTIDGGYVPISLSDPARITHWQPLPEAPHE